MIASTLLLAVVSNALPSAEAVRLYDEGAYKEACELLRGQDAEGHLDGPLLYRLFFCERADGHEDAAQKALDRARQALEKENTSSPTLEVPFYLANVYGNMGRPQEARTVAEAATKQLESGKLPAPVTGIGCFQVGKLYQDQHRDEEAVRWYTRAVAAFDPASARYANNLRWALRYLGNSALARADFAAADAALTRLTELGNAQAADWNALAVSRVRLGKYAAASAAWNTAATLDPENADDPRYAVRVADRAARLAPLPTALPDGKTFASMSQDELEATMKSEAAEARATHVEAAKGMDTASDGTVKHALAPSLRASLQAKLDGTKRLFTAATLEYAVRRLPIRETAFREGYAVLIFSDREWEIPPDPEG